MIWHYDFFYQIFSNKVRFEYYYFKVFTSLKLEDIQTRFNSMSLSSNIWRFRKNETTLI